MAKKKQKKLYKTIIQVEVLSEEKLDVNNLSDLHYAITEGSCSGIWNAKKPTILKGKDAVKATKAQGSDPEFFFMDNEGNSMED